MEPEIRVEDLSKSYYPKQRKGIFKSETTEVEALKSVSLEIMQGAPLALPRFVGRLLNGIDLRRFADAIQRAMPRTPKARIYDPQ